MGKIIRAYPHIGLESTDYSYQSALSLISADTAAATASLSIYCVPTAGPLTYTNFNLLASTISGAGGKLPGWYKIDIGGIVYRSILLADS